MWNVLQLLSHSAFTNALRDGTMWSYFTDKETGERGEVNYPLTTCTTRKWWGCFWTQDILTSKLLQDIASQRKAKESLGLAFPGLLEEFGLPSQMPMSTAFYWFSIPESSCSLYLICRVLLIPPSPAHLSIKFHKGNNLINLNEHFTKILFPELLEKFQQAVLNLGEMHFAEVAVL